MSAQLRLPGFPVPVPVSRNRPRIADLTREVLLLREALARERAERAREAASVRTALADLRHRLAEMERAAGLSDLARAPAGGDALRRFAGSRA